MRSLALALLLALLLPATGLASREPGGSGVLYGPGHVYYLAASAGWVFDNESGVGQGLHAVQYPVGSTWADSRVVIYTGVSHGRLAEVMADDLARFRKDHPDVQVRDLEPLTTGDGRVACVREFRGDRFGNVERLAYIETPEVVCEIVLTGRDEAATQSGLEAFRFAVGSFRFLTADVEAWKSHVEAGGDPRQAP